MTKNLEKFNPKSPKVLAVEIAVGGLIAWKYRAKLLRQYDQPGQPEPPPTPVSEIIDGSPVYIMQTGSNGFEIGMKHPKEGFIGISGIVAADEDGKDTIEIDEDTSESNPDRLQLLLGGIRTARRRWAHKKNF